MQNCEYELHLWIGGDESASRAHFSLQFSFFFQNSWSDAIFLMNLNHLNALKSCVFRIEMKANIDRFNRAMIKWMIAESTHSNNKQNSLFSISTFVCINFQNVSLSFKACQFNIQHFNFSHSFYGLFTSGSRSLFS